MHLSAWVASCHRRARVTRVLSVRGGGSQVRPGLARCRYSSDREWRDYYDTGVDISCGLGVGLLLGRWCYRGPTRVVVPPAEEQNQLKKEHQRTGEASCCLQSCSCASQE